MRLNCRDLWQVTSAILMQTSFFILVANGQSGNTGSSKYRRCDSISAEGNPTPGQCIEFPLCPRLLEFAKRPGKPAEDFKLLSQLTCGFNRDKPRICCPDADIYYPPAPDDTEYLPLNFPEEDEGTRVNGKSRNSVSAGLPNIPYNKGSLDSLIPQLEDCGEPRYDIATSTRIIGGTTAQPGQFPYMALLYRIDTETDEEEYYCAGTIINQFYILSAAHCVLTNQNTTTQLAFILVGITDVSQRCYKNNQAECLNERRYEVKETVVHPKYVYGSRDKSHDIALIRTAQPIELNKDYIRPVCLPIPKVYGISGETMSGTIPEENKTPILGAALVAGWGRQTTTGSRQTSQNLKSVILPILSRTECQQRYTGQVKISEKQICAGGELGRDTCVGDSGGPLLSPLMSDADNSNERHHTGKIFQTGIVSYGPFLCAITGKPSVYTRVASYIDWILDNMYLY